MSDTGNEPTDPPTEPSPDDLFAAAARVPDADDLALSEETGEGPEPAGDDEAGDDEAREVGAADSVFGDDDIDGGGASTPDVVSLEDDDEVAATDEVPSEADPLGGGIDAGLVAGDAAPFDGPFPQQGRFGYHVPPPQGLDGPLPQRAGEYPAGPPLPPQPQFGRRAPRQGPVPDADGFYPSDYYLGVDWLRVVLTGLAGTVVLIGLVAGGLYLFDRFDPRDDENEVAAVEPTVVPEVEVYACAGDPDPVTTMPPPEAFLIQGRDAGSRWLAFRNPQSGRRQLWVRSSALPAFDASGLGVVSCAASDLEFPTPIGAPTAQPTVGPPPTPTTLGDVPTPTPVATPTPEPTATPTPTPEPTATPTPPPPTATPEPPDGDDG